MLGLTIETFPGGASLGNFMGTLASTDGMVYAYDLTLGDFVTTNPPETQAELATALVDEDVMRLRDDAPYLAQRQVLIELGLAPADVAGGVIRDGISVGAERYAVASDDPAPSVIIDRLSPRSVERLTDAYVGLFGVRDVELDGRPGIWAIADTLANGSEDEVDEVMSRIGLVLDRIALLELTPREIDRAQRNLLEMVRPDSIESAMFRSQWAKN